jgi:hypothetical protein
VGIANMNGAKVSASLGPFQPIWDAWDESNDEITGKPLSHFRRAMEVQFEELQAHLDANNDPAAANEAADIISVALNVMRWLGHSPDEVIEIVRVRAAQRLSGQTQAILEKYQRLYKI